MAKCLYCGAEIIGKSHHKGKERKYCSRECQIKDKDYKQWAYTICQYCGKTFKESRDRANLYCSNACSAKGGAHTWDNVQLACRICNSVKRDIIPPHLKK